MSEFKRVIKNSSSLLSEAAHPWGLWWELYSKPSFESFAQVLCPLIVPGLCRECCLALLGNSRSRSLTAFQMWCHCRCHHHFCWISFTSQSLKWMRQSLWHFSLFIVKVLGKKFGVGGLFICMKDDGETCSPTGRPFYLSVDARLQGSVFISAEQPVNGHCKSWKLSCPARLKSVHLLGTYVGKAEPVLPHVKTFPL